MTGRTAIFLFLLLICGCAPKSKFNRSYVSENLRNRSGQALNPDEKAQQFKVPENVNLNDGLTEPEAIALALYNNAQYQADLAQIYIAEADLIDAGQLPNPILAVAFPYGTNYFKQALSLPLQFLVMRPKRVAAAKAETARVSYDLVSRGLQLIRNVQLNFADLKLTEERYKIIKESAAIRGEISRITQARFKAGEISELETSVATIDSMRALDEFTRIFQDTLAFRYRLNLLVGLDSVSRPVKTYFTAIQPATSPKKAIIDSALTGHPDVLAARLAIEASGNRIGLERTRIFNFIATLNTQQEDINGFTAAPAFQVDLPILNQNRGAIKRAKAQFDQASRQYTANRQRVSLEVQETYTAYQNALKLHLLWQNTMIPQFERDLKLAQKAYVAGGVSYLFVLEFSRQLIDARLRTAEAEAQVRRSMANLNFSAGRKIF
jgi:cobalt-zinc-cadmium efflux system outer membrane protein